MKLSQAVLLSGIALAAAGGSAAALTAANGKALNAFADPNDFVIELDVAGSCGSKFFHIQRSKANFKEVAAVAMTAVATGRRMLLFVEGCGGDRNILSHGAILG